MKKLLSALALALAPALLLTTGIALGAGYKGTIEFSQEEKQAHAAALGVLTDSAARCLQGDLARHKEFFSKYGISAFYGDQSKFARKTVVAADGTTTFTDTSLEERWQALRALGFPENYVRAFIPADRGCTPERCVNMMQPTSCIGITMRCLSKAFAAAGEADLWKRVRDFTVANGSEGDALLEALQKLGWRIYYWTPDLKRLAEWDAQEQRDYPGNPAHAWGYHAYAYRTVSTKGLYYRNHVDDFTTMVNFGLGSPAHIRDVPFFVGIAHLGYHVFPGYRGTIIEGHSARELTDSQTVQASPFSPIAPNGGPGGGPYHSGIVAVPPGY